MLFGFLDHQVDIQRQFCDPPAGFNDEWSHGDVGDESSVHHINMDPVDAGVFSLVDLVRQVGKIC